MASSVYLNPRYPDAIWDISGAFNYDHELIAFHDFCRQVIGQSPLHYVHGAPLCEWNSGRLSPELVRCPQSILKSFKAYNEKQIPLLLTLSNTLLTEKHMNDPMGNSMLEVLNQYNSSGKNGVIMSNDLLNTKIKQNFPQLQRIPSILKITTERGKGKREYYEKLLDEFDLVMMHPDDVFNLDFIAELPEKHRLILLINEYCIRNCPIRHLHYKDLSEASLNFFSHDDRPFNKVQSGNGCMDIFHLLTHPTGGSLAQSTAELDQLYSMGFRHFKLQGRGRVNSLNLLSDVLRFTLNTDAADENAMHSLRQRFFEALNSPNA